MPFKSQSNILVFRLKNRTYLMSMKSAVFIEIRRNERPLAEEGNPIIILFINKDQDDMKPILPELHFD